MSEQALYRPRDAAARLGVSTRTLARWADRGILAHTTTPTGQRRYVAEQVDHLAVHGPYQLGLPVLQEANDAP